MPGTRQRFIEASDTEWDRVTELALLAGESVSRFLIRKATAREAVPVTVLRRAMREILILSILEERRTRELGPESGSTMPPMPWTPGWRRKTTSLIWPTRARPTDGGTDSRRIRESACPPAVPVTDCEGLISHPDRAVLTLRTLRTRLRFPASGAIVLAGFLAACGGENVSYEGVEDTMTTPQGRFEPDIDDPDRETIFGSGGINALWSGSESDRPGGGLGVNAFLWRASLDTLAFLPPLSADPFGGVIIYDWYRPPASPEERLKVAVYILDTRLTASALRVAVNRQVRGTDGWQDAVASEDTATALENAILTQARLLRIAWLGE